MKATEIVLEQHASLRQRFEALRRTGDSAEQLARFEGLAEALVRHHALERDTIYRACVDELDGEEEVFEALSEHTLIDLALRDADRARHTPDFASKCEVLREIFEHHASEEEHELLPEIARRLPAGVLDALGARMRAAEAHGPIDFRVALEESLRDVPPESSRLLSVPADAAPSSHPSDRMARRTAAG